jgi:dienelactone hydrolase
MQNTGTKCLCAAFVAAILIATAGTLRAEIRTETVIYQAGQVQAHGFLVYDDSVSGKRPGVVVVPEWWGLNDYPKTRAKMLASLGYVALAADIYGDGKNTTDPKQAGTWAGEMRAGDRKELRARIAAALDRLKRDPRVDAARTAAIGYCFGGGAVLELARSGADVTGVVSFHGNLDTAIPASPGEVKARVLVCHGANDPHEPPAQVQAFQDEMRNAKADWQMNIYSGAEHGFTNPANADSHLPGVAYNKEADQRSWRAMQDFFQEIFSSPPLTEARKGNLLYGHNLHDQD